MIIIGYMANNVLPARLGELVRAVYLSQREKEVSVPASIATLSVERLYDGLTLLAMGRWRRRSCWPRVYSAMRASRTNPRP